MKFLFWEVGGVKKIDMRSKKYFKTNPPERIFKIGFKNSSQEDLAQNLFLSVYLFFLTTHNFDDKLKISDSVDFEQP